MISPKEARCFGIGLWAPYNGSQPQAGFCLHLADPGVPPPPLHAAVEQDFHHPQGEAKGPLSGVWGWGGSGWQDLGVRRGSEALQVPVVSLPPCLCQPNLFVSQRPLYSLSNLPLCPRAQLGLADSLTCRFSDLPPWFFNTPPEPHYVYTSQPKHVSSREYRICEGKRPL